MGSFFGQGSPVGGLVLLVALATSCGDSGPVWIDLADGFRPELSLAATSSRTGVSFYSDAGGTWLTTDLALEDWEPSPWPGIWQTPRPSVPIGSPETGAATRLVAGEQSFLSVPLGGRFDLEKVPPDSFADVGEYLFVMPKAAGPPEASTFWSFVDVGSRQNGAWRVESDGVAANGIPVLPGTRQTIRVDVPAASVLRFRTLALGPAGEAVALSVRAGGELLFEHEQALGLVAALEHHVIELPAGELELSFECAGPPAFAAFLVPRVGPADVGTFGARPWGQAQPDLVVFLADTFRADNLTAYGGRGLAPNLDALVERSVVFTQARSSSSWTLPSHASILSGLHPPQHGVIDGKHFLGVGAATIAESLREAGYRTVAVTERGWVVPEFGLDQGFETFEYFAGIENTLARADELAQDDDGRPLFLFVHTYRTHTPYMVSEEVQAELGIEEDWAAVDARRRPLMGDWKSQDVLTPVMRESLGALRQLYDGTVVDLDRAFAPFFDRLEELGVLGQDDFLFFLSDHGESFGEHDYLWHGFGVWDDLTRVPLFVYSPSLQPLASDAPASHVDVAPTIAHLLGTPVDSSWAGRSLFAPRNPDEPHDVFLYACRVDDTSYFGFLDGTRKVVMHPREDVSLEPQVAWAFDVEANPSEAEELQLTAEEAQVLLRIWRSRLDEAEIGLLESQSMTMTPEREAELRALGYL